MHGTRLAKQNIHMVAGASGISVKELDKKMADAFTEFKNNQNKKWSISFFHKDEAWYDETMKKIYEIETSLPKDMEPKERIKKIYGWIEPHRKLTQPLMDEDDKEYVQASTVQLALLNPDLYIKIQNFD